MPDERDDLAAMSIPTHWEETTEIPLRTLEDALAFSDRVREWSVGKTKISFNAGDYGEFEDIINVSGLVEIPKDERKVMRENRIKAVRDKIAKLEAKERKQTADISIKLINARDELRFLREDTD